MSGWMLEAKLCLQKQVQYDEERMKPALRNLLLLLAASLALTACGLQPMYAGGRKAAVAEGLAAVEVSAIQGRGGWLVKNALEARLGVAGQSVPRYRLDVRLDDSLEALGVLNDDTISRERRILRARYQLVDLSTGGILLDATAGSDAGIDVVSSEYATIAAEQKALENLALDVADRMATQVALTLRAQASRQP
jgi:LPS-assembly lipoprotein